MAFVLKKKTAIAIVAGQIERISDVPSSVSVSCESAVNACRNTARCGKYFTYLLHDLFDRLLARLLWMNTFTQVQGELLRSREL